MDGYIVDQEVDLVGWVQSGSGDGPGWMGTEWIRKWTWLNGYRVGQAIDLSLGTLKNWSFVGGSTCK